jgi:hypothetical protein
MTAATSLIAVMLASTAAFQSTPAARSRQMNSFRHCVSSPPRFPVSHLPTACCHRTNAFAVRFTIDSGRSDQ